MYGYEDLKSKIQATDSFVECPVVNCSIKVARQRKSFKREKRFYCADHSIYISPSTFEYNNYRMNLLCLQDQDMLESIFQNKRESRMSRDNSEDALTFNIFRFLERDESTFLKWIYSQTNIMIKKPQLMYWSHDMNTNQTYESLNNARKEFGERISRSSEPDLLISGENCLILVEAKLTASNNTLPSNIRKTANYLTGGNRWFNKVLMASYEEIVNIRKKYELLRFWLLGTWMAYKEKKNFCLLNLVPDNREANIEKEMCELLKVNDNRRFKRATWESIYHMAKDSDKKNEKTKAFLKYIENKTIGYRNGKLKKAFTTMPI